MFAHSIVANSLTYDLSQRKENLLQGTVMKKKINIFFSTLNRARFHGKWFKFEIRIV